MKVRVRLRVRVRVGVRVRVRVMGPFHINVKLLFGILCLLPLPPLIASQR